MQNIMVCNEIGGLGTLRSQGMNIGRRSLPIEGRRDRQSLQTMPPVVGSMARIGDREFAPPIGTFRKRHRFGPSARGSSPTDRRIRGPRLGNCVLVLNEPASAQQSRWLTPELRGFAE